MNFTMTHLQPDLNQSSWVSFIHTGYPRLFFLAELKSLVKEIRIDPWGNMRIHEYYQIINMGSEWIFELPFYLPANATEVLVQDVYGKLSISEEEKARLEYRFFTVKLREPLEPNGKVKIFIDYKLPFWKYVKRSGFNDYRLNLNFTSLNLSLARRMTLRVKLPEGSNIISAPLKIKGGSEGELTLSNATRFSNINFNLEYKYNILWSSFRPIVWVGTLAVILSSLLYIKGFMKPHVTVPAARIPRGTLERFIQVYEESMKIRSELRALERRARKGKIPRRQYKLRSKSLTEHLSRIRRELTNLREKMEEAGGRYADLMRQLEVSEIELETLDEDIERVKSRYRRGELSPGAYRRLLEDYNRRRARAEDRISEVIIRLREDLH